MDALCALHEEDVLHVHLSLGQQRLSERGLGLRPQPRPVSAAEPLITTKEQPNHGLSQGVPFYRALLGLGAGDSDCLCYDVMQFVDIGMSGFSVAKGKSAISKMSPEKVNPEWDENPDKVTPMMWTRDVDGH